MGNISSRRYEEVAFLAKLYTIISWTVGCILFLTCLIYAGERGYYAYHHLPAEQTNFQSSNQVNYPAITICPLEPFTPIISFECVHETRGIVDFNCSSFVHTDAVQFEGRNMSCFTFNDPSSSSSNIVYANSTNEELAISVIINATNAVEVIGGLVILHEQGVAPALSTGNSFLADVGELKEVYLSKYIEELIDDSTVIYWTGTASSASLKEAGSISSIVISIDFIFDTLGVYNVEEYYTYEVDNWIGEVGGLAALLLFLHGAFVLIVMEIISFVYKRRQRTSMSMREPLRD